MCVFVCVCGGGGAFEYAGFRPLEKVAQSFIITGFETLREEKMLQ